MKKKKAHIKMDILFTMLKEAVSQLPGFHKTNPKPSLTSHVKTCNCLIPAGNQIAPSVQFIVAIINDDSAIVR